MKEEYLLRNETEDGIIKGIKSQLSLIKSNIDFLGGIDADAVHIKNYILPVIKKSLKRINDLIDNSAKSNIDADEDVYICSLIKEIISKYSIFNTRKEIMFDMACSKEDIAFRFNKIKAEILFYNIYKNAVEAMGERGNISAHIAENENEVTVDIIDSGRGISDKIMDKIGEPFVTTKQNSDGLGLSICKSIISEYSGTFEIMNIDTGGCLVRVCIPKAK